MESEPEVRQIVHDINNALTATMGAAELILAESSPESQTAQDARDIVAASIKGRDLVLRLREVLQLS